MIDIYRNGTYAAANPHWHEEDSPWKAHQIERMMRKHELRPHSIAEIGCGAGGILRCLHDDLPFVPELHGFDTAEAPLEMARHKETEHLHFHQQDLLELPEIFDLLLVIDVVEHVPDYLSFLEQCREHARLKIYHIPLEIHASAVLRGTVTYAREPVGHIHYFSAESALASLRDTGHHILDTLYTPGAIGLARLHRSLRRTIANVPRRLTALISQKLAARLFGGYSLLVLAE